MPKYTGNTYHKPNKHWDKEWLTEQYVINKINIHDIAFLCNVSYDAIMLWIKKFNIPHIKDVNKRIYKPVIKEIKHRKQFHSELKTIWKSMKKRCAQKGGKDFKDYGGRGIIVCDKWLNNFQAFYNDVIGTYKKGLTLDRYPNKDGNYEPLNFRWATMKEQANNRRSNVIIFFNGKQYTLTQLVNIYKINICTVQGRLRRGWSINDAITKKPAY